MVNRKHTGQDFDDFLREEGILEHVNARVLKRVIAWQVAAAMEKAAITKSEMARRMGTSRTVVNRVLDEKDTGITLETLAKVCKVLDAGMDLRLVPARAVQPERKGTVR